MAAALNEQIVTVPGTRSGEQILPRLAEDLAWILDRRKKITAELEEVLEEHPFAQVLIYMPGVGVRTGARILLEVVDVSAFPTSGPSSPRGDTAGIGSVLTPAAAGPA